jgi:fructuronate reductase
MAKSGGDWGILGVSLQSPRMRDALAPQGFAYTAVEQGPGGETAQIVDVVQEVRVAREDPQAVLAAMAAPGVKIVSLTITEKGYCHDPATGALREDHPDILHDLASPLPVSAPGFIVRALAARRAAGLRPFTVLSCDNLPDNGQLTRGVILSLAEKIDPSLAVWIAENACFPSTMIDRIVPATKPQDTARIAALTGLDDAAPVLHEPFRQWVIEDRFVNGERPDLGAVGVQMVADVRPYELMKLRMLNGTHSALAYLGYLAGHETIADTVANPAFAQYVRRLWTHEIIPTLAPPEGQDLSAYAEALFDRYANPSIRHRTWQIAMDGSQKLPQRILGTLADNCAAGRPSPGLLLAVAAWMRYVGGIDEIGAAIEVKDPLASTLRALSDGAEGVEKVTALLSVRAVFPAGLAARLDPLVRPVFARLISDGAAVAVASLQAP